VLFQYGKKNSKDLTKVQWYVKLKNRKSSHRNGLEEGNQKKMAKSLILNQFDNDIWNGGFLVVVV